MQEVSRSVHGCTHEANVILTTSGHELLFIITSVDGFRGCMMNTLIWLWIHKHDSCYSWQALSRFPINACTNIYYGKEGLCVIYVRINTIKLFTWPKTNTQEIALVYQDDQMLQHAAELKDVPHPTWQSSLLPALSVVVL